MSNAIVKTSGVKVMKKTTLKQNEAAIKNLDSKANKAQLEIAFRLAYIKTECGEELKKEGYKNVIEYAEKKFDYARQTTYKYIQIAEKFIKDYKQGTLLVHEDGTDYNKGQLIELLPLTVDDIKKYEESKEISPTMTTKQLREAVKKITKPESGGDGESEGDGESDVIDTTCTDESKEWEKLAKMVAEMVAKSSIAEVSIFVTNTLDVIAKNMTE